MASKYYIHPLTQGALMNAKMLIMNSGKPFYEEKFDLSKMATFGMVIYSYEYEGETYQCIFTDDYVGISGSNPDKVAIAFGLKPDVSYDSPTELRAAVNRVAASSSSGCILPATLALITMGFAAVAAGCSIV